jgi:probable HAF family extracellular repeat protein
VARAAHPRTGGGNGMFRARVARGTCGFSWLVLLACAGGARGDVYYTVTDIGLLPGANDSQAQGLSSNGLVAGESDMRGFLWQDGVLTDVGTLGGSWSNAMRVNASGQVVGWSNLPGDNTGHAFMWQTGTMTDLGTLGGRDSAARDINDCGQIVGWSSLPGRSSVRAVLWQNGQITDLGTLGGNSSAAYNVNSSGAIVGYASRASGPSHAFLFADGVMNDLGALGADDSSIAFGVNDLNQVVGLSWPPGPGTKPRGFLWSAGTMADIGSLGGPQTRAFAINSAGQAVGYSEAPGAPGEPEWIYHAFVCEAGTMLDLNDLINPQSGWQLYEAFDINDAGQVVGMGETNGAIHGFLLTPIPEPATLVLLASAGLLLGRRRA